MPYQKIGYKFEGLNQFTEGIEYIGYFTDTNINDQENSKIFAQAQYLLAPAILDYNNVEHEYILFVCEDEKKAWAIIKDIGAEPLRRNQYGMILAKRKK